MLDEYITKNDALNFEISIDSTPERIQLIMEGMAFYSDYLKNLEPIKAITIDEAINVLKQLRNNHTILNKQVDYGIRLAIQAIRNIDPKLPHYEPLETKSSHWIMSNEGTPFCPICRADSPSHQKTPFCPYCGTHMTNSEKSSL